MLIKYAIYCISVLMICSCSSPDVHAPLGRSDAIIVLAGSYQERVPAVVPLFQGRHAPVIILTNDGVRGGWSRKYQRSMYQIERAEELLVELGVPRMQIVRLPFYGSGTVYDALAVQRYAETHGNGRLLLVTSDYHSRRALWIFQRVFRDRPKEISVFSVSSDGSVVKETVLECVKLLFYRIRFGLLGLLPDIDQS